MTDDELLAWARKAKSVTKGSLDPLWDVIADAEEIVAGRSGICTRQQIEDMIARDTRVPFALAGR